MPQKKIVDIDCRTRSVDVADVPEEYTLLGGRALTSTIISNQVDPLCHPLGENNILVVAPGLIAGSTLSSSNRLSVGAKSPLTHGIKESNSGGVASLKLARLGIKALILRNVPEERDFPSLGIIIRKDGIFFEDMPFVKGKNTYESADILREKYGDKIGFLLIGAAGERRLSSACISVNDMEGEPCRNIGRGGLGAVLGSKGIKAIVIDDSDCENPFAGNTQVRDLQKLFANKLRENPVTGERFPKYGTAMTLKVVNELGGLPTRNFRSGEFEGAETIGPDALHDTIKERGGMPTHACMPGCVIRCSNKYVDEQGNPVVGSVDYENMCLLGSNIGISDLDQVVELNFLCNDIGVDTIEIGAALGVLAEGGVFEFGDYPAIRKAVVEIGEGTPLGMVLGAGAEICGRAYGVTRIPVVKGQGMAAYDPRAIKGQGVTYSQSPMGADHTAGNAITLGVDHLDPNVQIEPVQKIHINSTVLDMLGLCAFTGRVSLAETDLIEKFVDAVAGVSMSFESLQESAKKILLLERDFNVRAGLGPESDRLPEFMMNEALPPHNSVFDVPLAELASFFEFDAD